MFERIKQDWDKIVYMALGFFILFYIGFYFSSFSSEPEEQRTKRIVVVEKMDNPIQENITAFDGDNNYNIVDRANAMTRQQKSDNGDRDGDEDGDGDDDENADNEGNSEESMDRTVEDILSQVHKEGDMCKELDNNIERETYCGQLDPDTCKQKSCCVTLYDKYSEPQSCTVGDEGGPTYAQTKSMRFYSFMQEPKQEL